MTQPSNLNDVQWQAVISPQPRLLITAGPGTGKTHTLTHRIARLLNNPSQNQKILAITFTNKAAEEMRARVQNLVKDSKESLELGTFHNFCLRVLKEFADKAGLSAGFQVATEEEVKEIARALWPGETKREISERLSRIFRRKSSLEKFDHGSSSPFSGTLARPSVPGGALVRPRSPAVGGNRARSSSRSPSKGLPEPLSAELDGNLTKYLSAYNSALREKSLLDFDDLLIETVFLLEKNPDTLATLQARFANIFVDEYQDINAVQYALLKLLVGETGSITAIGDPMQAIYGFRGSDIRYFESFQNDFPGAALMTLNENYRSAKKILSASGQVIAGNNDAQNVATLTARLITEGQLTIHAAATDKAEAEYVVHAVERLVGGTSMFSQDSGRVKRDEDGHWGFNDVTVLFRLKAQAYCLKAAFERSGIPYHIAHQVDKEKGEDSTESVCPSRTEPLDFQADKVTLMTLHAAKGLEFGVVFIVGCEDTLLPLCLENFSADKEEERRLFYVGMTRAKEKLFLLRAKKRALFGKFVENNESPFLKDIAEELKEYEREQVLKGKKRDQQIDLFS